MSGHTLERLRIIMLPAEDVRRVFEKDQAFARAVVMELAYCDRGAINGVKRLKLRTTIERLANYLLKWQKKLGGSAEFSLPVEKRRLASILGMTPENLSRSIKYLRPYGVKITGQVMKIAKPDALKALAKPTPLIDDPRS